MAGRSDTGSARPAGDVTRLLRAWSAGDEEALKDLMPLVYGELRRGRGPDEARAPGHTLQPTAMCTRRT